MDQPAAASRSGNGRFLVLVALAVLLVGGFGVLSHMTHSATIPNVGLPASNSKTLPGLSAYDPQVKVATEYLTDLTTLNYAAAYQLLAPSVRTGLSEAAFEAQRRAEGVLSQSTVWPDDQTSIRAEYTLGKANGSSDTRRHRFQLSQEQGRWWMDGEVALPASLAPSPSLNAALTEYVQQRAGSIWTKSLELLRQEGFDGGQLLLFSYIEPHPSTQLTAERVALLAYYVNGPSGWTFAGGGNTGLAAGMSVADVAMGFTTFGQSQQYTAYYGVVENSNAVSLSFQEPNGAVHTQDLKGQQTVLFINERNPYEQLPFSQPFTSLVVKDVHGNLLRTNPELTASG